MLSHTLPYCTHVPTDVGMMRIHTYTHIYTHIHTYTHIYTYIHTYTHIYTHIQGVYKALLTVPLRVHMLDGSFISVRRVKLSEYNALILCTSFILHGREESKNDLHVKRAAKIKLVCLAKVSVSLLTSD